MAIIQTHSYNTSSAFDLYKGHVSTTLSSCSPKLQVINGYRSFATSQVTPYIASARPVMSASQVLTTEVAFVVMSALIVAMWLFL